MTQTKIYILLIGLFILFQSCRKQEEPKQISKVYPQKILPSTDFQSKLFFNQFTSKEGLPSTQIWNIYQDRFGYMWIATSEGIARFDGYNFYPYYDNVEKGIRLKMSSFFFEDSDGTLWVLNGAGFLNKFIRNEDRFEAKKTPFENGWSVQSTHTIVEDSLKNFWISAYDGLQYWDRKKDSIMTYPIQRIRDTSWQHEEKLRFGKMVFDKRGNIWLGTRKFGFVKFNIASKSYHCYRFDKDKKHRFLEDWIPDFVTLADGTLLISEWGEGGLVHFDPITEKIIKVVKINDLLGIANTVNIRDIHDEGNEVFSLGTDADGLIIYDLKNNRIVEQYKNDKNTYLGISGNTIRCIFKDKLGTHWFGAGNLQNASTKFYHFGEFTNDKNNPKSLRNDLIYSLSPTKTSKLLISTSQGMSVFDTETQTFENEIDLGIKNEQSYGVLEDQDGTYWLSYKDKIVHFEPTTKRIIKSYLATMVVDDQNNFLKRACRMMQDSKGRIWTISHWGRLNVIDEKQGKVQQITALAQDPKTKEFVNVLGFIDDPQHQQVIVCSDFGLATVAYADNSVNHKRLIFNGLDISNEAISTIFRDSTNKIWLLISGKPYILNPSDYSLEAINLASIYDVESFKWIAESPSGTMWLSCFRGIVKYDVKNKTSSIYYTPNVGDNTFDYTSPVANLNGKLFFSGFKGLTMVEPDKIPTNQGKTNTIIESMKIPIQKNKNINKTLFVFDKNEIELDYFQNKFSIKYVGLRFHDVDEIKYAYKLEGYDTDWISADTKQEAIYTNLSPKTYTFQVKSLDNPTNIAQLKIIIYPPFWLTWWAFLLYLLFISGLIYLFIQYRVKAKLEKFKELEALRINISSNLHDDVGTILSGLAMQSQMLAITTHKDQKASLLELSDMSHEAMERMRDTVWAIDSRKDKYENLIDRMRAFAEKNLHLKNIKHTFSIEVEDAKRFIDPEKRQNIYLIFKEAITNICKHSDAQNVQILFRQERNQLFLSVHDDGRIKKQANSDGVGLNNMKMRATKIGANLEIIEGNGYLVELVMKI